MIDALVQNKAEIICQWELPFYEEKSNKKTPPEPIKKDGIDNPKEHIIKSEN